MIPLYTIQIKFPEDFENRYKAYKTRILGASKSVPEEPIANLQDSGTSRQNRPYCIPEGTWGFLKFGKYGEKVKIGLANSQPFRLLQCLTEPFGNPKSVDTVFESVRESVQYKSKTGVYTSAMDKAQKVKIIEYVIKELQKENKLRGKIQFKWDELKTKLWLEYTE